MLLRDYLRTASQESSLKLDVYTAQFYFVRVMYGVGRHFGYLNHHLCGYCAGGHCAWLADSQLSACATESRTIR
ncbi:conserved protein of unknown function [Citrobacter amalonaticus]|uniref:Uncharacterized protein n=1 Tax=Citrobacter amalonaticus TaxID=35703 RepID=A0AAX2BEZ4_CITAM|nr:conserved protein of unknown function [Citrobacter amalonaticus]